LKSVYVQEMLHTHIVANAIAALGFEVDFLNSIPSIPTLLPHLNKEIMINLHPLTEDNVETFEDIESPADPIFRNFHDKAEDTSFESIGSFYMQLIDKIEELQIELNTDRQLGTLYPNTNLLMDDIPSLVDNLKLIIEQGEGSIGDPEEKINHYQTFQTISRKLKDADLKHYIIPASGNWTKGLLHDPDFKGSKHVARLKKMLNAFNACYTYLFYCFDGIWNHYPAQESERERWRDDREQWVLSMRAVMGQTLPLLAKEIFKIKIPVVDGLNVMYITPAATFERYHFKDGSIVDQLEQLIELAKVDVRLGNIMDAHVQSDLVVKV